MRDQNINTFQKGMMTDLGETLPQDGNYVYGENIRIVSNNSESGETGIVVNVKGNNQYCSLVRNIFIIEDQDEDDEEILGPQRNKVFELRNET